MAEAVQWADSQLTPIKFEYVTRKSENREYSAAHF